MSLYSSRTKATFNQALLQASQKPTYPIHYDPSILWITCNVRWNKDECTILPFWYLSYHMDSVRPPAKDFKRYLPPDQREQSVSRRHRTQTLQPLLARGFLYSVLRPAAELVHAWDAWLGCLFPGRQRSVPPEHALLMISAA